MFEAICQAMSAPRFYPHPAENFERRDTHISTVFLAGPWVYKLKKPVKFDFLDFQSLENRRQFCEREVLLNQRLSRGIYYEVTGICQNDTGEYSLLPDCQVVEYTLKMARRPQDKSLDALIRTSGIHDGIQDINPNAFFAFEIMKNQPLGNIFLFCNGKR